MIVWTMQPLAAMVVCTVWGLSEIALGRILHSKKDTANAQDKSSLRILWLTIAPSLTAGIYLGVKGVGFVAEGSFVISVAGLMLIILGLVIRWWAILTLKHRFTTDVSIQKDHALVTTGVYRAIRHPAYAASILSFLGLGMTFSNWLSVVVIVVPITAAFLYRIRVEEAVLNSHFGDTWRDYCRATRRLIPWVY